MTNNGRNLDPTPPGNLSDNVLGLLDSPVGEQPSRRLRENPVRAVQQHEWHGEDQLVGNNGKIKKTRQLKGEELDEEVGNLHISPIWNEVSDQGGHQTPEAKVVVRTGAKDSLDFT